MAIYHTKALKLLLERVAYKGYSKEAKAFFLRSYGGGQKRFTVAVRERIKETWETVREDMEDVMNDDLSEVNLKFLETLDGDVLIIRDDLEWED